ncbi:uncharacterized protein [Solanum tuberosum]|uniref:uncharacterized protein n=1 Tax=Solanum tuberosum TaxID=4113 RepID=UPI00073A3E2C|nr:PREDICTED: uncharacterized protein LOC102596948 [Solanum tuberosum]
MRHCSDAPAWKHFDKKHRSFSEESRNVRLGLSTDGFQPFGQTGKQYSSWPVIVTPYNLPPWICVNTYDISKKQNFKMRAALMWTISDFLAYLMLSGWSTAGRLACPYCMENYDAFTLTKGGKQYWFDNHHKFLPLNHPYRKDKSSFRKNRVVTMQPTPFRSGEDVLKGIEELGLKKVTELGVDIINHRVSRFSDFKLLFTFIHYNYQNTYILFFLYVIQRKFIDSLHQNFPRITEQEVDKKLDEDFASWFTRYARVHIDNQFIKALAEGPCRSTKQYTGYNVNGFKFHTKGRSFSRASDNSGVCIKGTNYSADDNDYYGVLTEILELEYKGSTPIKRTVLFKCEWFDPTPNVGMNIHPKYKLVDINHKRKVKKYEPFVLAMQAAQVYYASYPSLRRDKNGWWAVCKTKARGIVVMPPSYLSSPLIDVAEPFQCDEDGLRFDVVYDNENVVRNDPNGEFINLRDENDDLDDETEFHDEPESESDDENENEEAYCESGSE